MKTSVKVCVDITQDPLQEPFMISALHAHPAAGIASSVTGTTLDMIGRPTTVTGLQSIGAFSADSLSGSWEESSNASDWTAISGSAFTQVTGANSLELVTFERTQRYIRYTCTLVGTTPLVDLAVVALQQSRI